MTNKTIPDLLRDYQELQNSYNALRLTTISHVSALRDSISFNLLGVFRDFENQTGVKIAQVHCVRNELGEIRDVDIELKM